MRFGVCHYSFTAIIPVAHALKSDVYIMLQVQNTLDCVLIEVLGLFITLHQKLCSLRTKPWLSNDAALSTAPCREHSSLIITQDECVKVGRCDSCLTVGSALFSESAERLLQSPGEFRGAAGAGQSDDVLLWDGRFQPGNWPHSSADVMLLHCSLLLNNVMF